jgi:pimeloyl-ACP methyl ester carboxylesterase
VLFVHGWLDNLESFSPLLDALNSEGAPGHWLAMDLPGHGLSCRRPERTVYHFIDGVADILSIADHMGWNRFHLVGHSMGAALSLLLAAALPERVASVAAIDALGPVVAPESEFAERLRRHLVFRMQDRPHSRFFASPVEAIQRRAEVSGLPPLLIADMVQRNLQETEHGWCWRTDSRLRWPTPNRLTEGQARAALRAVVCPVLVFRAEKSLPRITGDIDARLDVLSRARLVRVPGGHHCHMEHPGLVARELISWWEQADFAPCA